MILENLYHSTSLLEPLRVISGLVLNEAHVTNLKIRQLAGVFRPCFFSFHVSLFENMLPMVEHVGPGLMRLSLIHI